MLQLNEVSRASPPYAKSEKGSGQMRIGPCPKGMLIKLALPACVDKNNCIAEYTYPSLFASTSIVM